MLTQCILRWIGEFPHVCTVSSQPSTLSLPLALIEGVQRTAVLAVASAESSQIEKKPKTSFESGQGKKLSDDMAMQRVLVSERRSCHVTFVVVVVVVVACMMLAQAGIGRRRIRCNEQRRAVAEGDASRERG